jgi:N-hydroxyarylamine O-acetyltransferase
MNIARGDIHRQVAMAHPDLGAYFARIGYAGPHKASLETLLALHALHPAAIPFENLDPLMSKPVRVDVPAISEKFIGCGRGGYCYEHNTFFQAALQALGFSVCTLAARVQWRLRTGSPPPPRYHMVLRIDLSEEVYIADVGFGRMTLTTLLRLVPDVEQATRHGPYRLTPVKGDYQLQAKMGETWEPIYQLSLQRQEASDWEVANWFTSTHPDSTFTRNLMAARSTAERLYGLFNNELRIHYRDGRIEQRTLRDAAEIAAVLQDEFKVRLPEGCVETLERLVAAAKP